MHPVYALNEILMKFLNCSGRRNFSDGLSVLRLGYAFNFKLLLSLHE